jgi:hypothetical protein
VPIGSIEPNCALSVNVVSEKESPVTVRTESGGARTTASDKDVRKMM